MDRCTVTVPDTWTPSALTRDEAARLAGAMQVNFRPETEAIAQAAPDALLVSGERLLRASTLANGPLDLAGGLAIAGQAGAAELASLREGGGDRGLELLGRSILAATSKPTDGIVSHYVNRPISQFISHRLLAFPHIRPIHATWGTALLAFAMVLCLLAGTERGLIAGALLFQAASIFDGVDGEIARATFRTTPQGAALDSLVDAATNLCFVGGVVLNLYLDGEHQAALAGAAGLAMLAFGMTVIGRRSRVRDQGLTFDTVKEHFRKEPSRLMVILTWLTMRDFYALAATLLIVADLVKPAVFAFAVIVTGWLVVVLSVVRRQAA